MSSGKQIPTRNESRSFGKRKSVPFETVWFAASQLCSLNAMDAAEEGFFYNYQYGSVLCRETSSRSGNAYIGSRGRAHHLIPLCLLSCAGRRRKASLSPNLRLSFEEVYGAIGFNLANQAEIEAMLANNNREFELLRERTRDANPGLCKKIEETRRSPHAYQKAQRAGRSLWSYGHRWK